MADSARNTSGNPHVAILGFDRSQQGALNCAMMKELLCIHEIVSLALQITSNALQSSSQTITNTTGSSELTVTQPTISAMKDVY